MRSHSSLARPMALALMAIGTVACMSTDTFAANRTWTSSTITTSQYQTKWGTAFASNWAANTVPTTADIAVFGPNTPNKYNVAVQGNTAVGGIQFITTGSQYNINNAIVIGAQGVNNQSGRSQNVNTPVLSADQTFQGNSSIGVSNMDINGKNLTTTTNVTINTLNQNGSTDSVVTVNGGNAIVLGGNVGTSAKVDFAVTSGFLTTADYGPLGAGDAPATYDSTFSTLTVNGGTYFNTRFGNEQGLTNWDIVSMSAGAIDLMGVGGDLVSNGYTQTGGTIKQYVGGVNENSSLQATDVITGNPTGPLTLGGTLDLDMTAAGSQAFAIGTTWNLFIGVNAGGNAASNFSSALLSNVDASSPYAGLSFSEYGTEWFTPQGTDGTWLVFQAQTGNLVVVPEPSTMVFAGLGVAMSGWTMWKKRRLSKLLAAKAG